MRRNRFANLRDFLEFRFQYKAVSAERCAACVMLGGVEIETEAQAHAYKRLLAKEGLLADPQVGDHLEVPACLPEHDLARIQQEFGRPCPRVDLRPENGEALSLANVLIAEHMRPAFPVAFEEACAGLPVELQRRVLRRVLRVVGDPVVTERMYGKPESEEKDE